MMKPFRCSAFLLVVSLVGAGSLRAQTRGSSDEGAPFLLLPIGAEGVALGRATTAMPSDESAFWNPAGLASSVRSKVVLLANDLAVGRSTAVSLLFSRPGVGTLGVSYLLMDEGSQESKDINDELLGSITTRNHLGVISAATRLFGRLDAGVNFKVVQYQYSCRGLCTSPSTVAGTYAIDGGLQWEPSARLPLRIGAMVAHLGPRLQIINAAQADPLPTRVRVAAAYDVLGGLLDLPDVQGWVTVEVQERPGRAGSRSLFVGSELVAGSVNTLFLRAGYIAVDPIDQGAASVGLGMQYQRYQVSVAKSLVIGPLLGAAEPFSVAFSVGF